MTKDEIFRLIQYDYNEGETFSNLFNRIWDAALESQPKWIPIKSVEELPDDLKRTYFTWERKDGTYFVNECVTNPKYWGRELPDNCHVVAYMPYITPEPYKL